MKKLLLVLLFTFNIHAAEIVRYINVASEGGNGTTNATTGENAAYKNKYDFNAAEATDLDAANNYMIVYCSGGTDTNNVTMNAWKMSSTDYLKFIGDGTYISSSTNAIGWTVTEEWVHFENIKFTGTSTGGVLAGCLYFTTNVGTCTNNVDRCTFEGGTCSGNGGMYGIRCSDSSITVNIRNCIFYNFLSSDVLKDNDFQAFYISAGAAINIYNCTIFKTGRGLYQTSGTVNLKNTVIGNTYDVGDDITVSSGTCNIDYCSTDDPNEGTNWVDLSPSATEADDWALAFTNYTTGDFSIKDVSSVLYNAGTDLSGSGVTTDIISTARPQATTYDIGAYEFVVAGAPAVKKPRIININMN